MTCHCGLVESACTWGEKGSSSVLAVSDTYPMFIEPTITQITRVPSGFSGYIWLDTKIVLKQKKKFCNEHFFRRAARVSHYFAMQVN